MSIIWKLLGYHVCEKFTKWERTVIHHTERTVCLWTGKELDVHKWDEDVQVRTCQECGKLYVENVL